MSYFTAKVYFKDAQVKGNALVNVEADGHSDAALQAEAVVKKTFKSCPTEIVRTVTTKLKRKPKWAK